jgi:polysaccharide export outer membrane protein
MLLAACQPTLESDLPTAPEAYQVLEQASTSEPVRYLVQPGDRLGITIYQEDDLSQPDMLVDEGGKINLPLIGEVQASGRTPAELARMIEQAYGSRFLRNPQASVALLAVRPRMITVEGQVNDPGLFEYQPGFTLLSAVAAAGSPAFDAKLDEVLVFRKIDGQRAGARFDLTEIRAGRLADPALQPGDTIVVGYSAVRGLWRDFLRTVPLTAIFTHF